MSKLTIEDTVYIDAIFLDKNLTNHIYDKLCEKFINTFHPIYGFISKIYEGITVLENKTSSSSTGVFFKVSFKVKAFLPKIKDVFTGKITKIIPAGVNVTIKHDISVFVPYLDLQKSGYKFSSTIKCFVSEKSLINLDSEVEVVIKSMKYESQKYKYIGIINFKE